MQTLTDVFWITIWCSLVAAALIVPIILFDMSRKRK